MFYSVKKSYLTEDESHWEPFNQCFSLNFSSFAKSLQINAWHNRSAQTINRRSEYRVILFRVLQYLY